ncbi:MAG: N-acetylglucosamine kinase [Steroidobacteraceae bacterium]
MKTYLGVDGGGSKTAFLLTDESGRVLASHTEGTAYYLEIGWKAMHAMLVRGIHTTLAQAAVAPEELEFAFLGLPAYGEDSRLVPELDAVAAPPLRPGKYRCGNDALCGWAGALAGQDGINIIAGTGSMAYGELNGRTARAGGWGELFSDEGSAYWIAREGLKLFARMSDGRAPRAALYDIVRRHFGLQTDLDLCAAIYGTSRIARSDLAALSPLIASAANAGDTLAIALFAHAADELAQIIHAVYDGLETPQGTTVKVSYSGGMFQQRDLLLRPLQSKLAEDARSYLLVSPRLAPVAGAALYAARLSGAPLNEGAVKALEERIGKGGLAA